MSRAWIANIEVSLTDEDARDLYTMTGIAAPTTAFDTPIQPTATVSLRVYADDPAEAFARALEQAARMAEGQR